MIPFITPALALASKVPARVYVYGAIAITILGLAWYGDTQRKNYKAEQKAFQTFKAQVEAVGKEAKRQATLQAAADVRNKERADDEAKRRTDILLARIERLRLNDDNRRYVPPAPSGSKRPDLACFDRAELDGAIRRLTGGLRPLAGKGDKSALDLEIAAEWAAGLKR